MAKLTKQSILNFDGKEYVVSDLLQSLCYLTAEETLHFFEAISLKLPRQLRIYVLKAVLYIPQRNIQRERSTLADELGYRLRWFEEFSDTQLENLLLFLNDQKVFKEYLEQFWLAVLVYMIDVKADSRYFISLFDKAIDKAAKTNSLPNMQTYNIVLSPLFTDVENTIDGLTPRLFRPVLFKSSTIIELRQLGQKYHINVPKRLKKSEIIEFIIHELKDRNQYAPDIEVKLDSMPIIMVQRFAKDNDIKISTELRKEEIIEYILKHAETTKGEYYKPESADVYNIEIEEVQKELEKDDNTLFSDVNVDEYTGLEIETSVDSEAPKIFINQTEFTVIKGAVLPDFKRNVDVVDDVDGNITDKLIIEIDNLDTNIVGDYTIILKAADAAGNIATKEIILHVIEDKLNVVAPIVQPTETVTTSVITETITVTDEKTNLEITKLNEKMDALTNIILLQDDTSTESAILEKEVVKEINKNAINWPVKIMLFILWLVLVVIIGFLVFGFLVAWLNPTNVDDIINWLNNWKIDGTGILDSYVNFWKNILS